MKAPERFMLTDSERMTLARFFDHLQARIVAVSIENESATHDLASTNFKRGQIKAFRELLRLGAPRTEELPPRP